MTWFDALLYPQLRSFPEKDRQLALRNAKTTSFDVIELLGIALGLVLVTAVTRYYTGGLNHAERVAAFLLNFFVAIPLLVVSVGPFLVRRVRRGLETELAKQRGSGNGSDEHRHQ
jgi:hypothetical protein